MYVSKTFTSHNGNEKVFVVSKHFKDVMIGKGRYLECQVEYHNDPETGLTAINLKHGSGTWFMYGEDIEAIHGAVLLGKTDNLKFFCLDRFAIIAKNNKRDYFAIHNGNETAISYGTLVADGFIENVKMNVVVFSENREIIKNNLIKHYALKN